MNKEIQILRGVAVLLTFVAHAIKVYPIYAILEKISFWVGVDIFFVISGFVISKSFFPKFEQCVDVREKIIETTCFLMRRFFRLIPTSLTWAFLLLIASLVFNRSMIFGPPEAIFQEFLSVVVYSKNIFAAYNLNLTMGPYWSLSLEEQFYFILPIILIYIPKALDYRIAITIITMTSLFPNYISSNYGYFKIGGFLAGIMLYKLSNTVYAKLFEPAFLRHRGVSLCTITLLLGLLLLVPGYLIAFPGVLFYVVILSSFVVHAATYDQGFVSFSSPLNKIFRWIGDRSYSLYVCHMPVLLFVYEFYYRFMGIDLSHASKFQIVFVILLSLVISLITASLSYSYIEKRTRRFGQIASNNYHAKFLG